MFKKNAALFILLGAVIGCRTAPPLPAWDLSDPAWTIRQGQAVWQLPRPGAPAIAGDLVVAVHRDGRAFVVFSKTPLTVATAQSTAAAWQFESPMQNRKYSGRGRAPVRIVWFMLPAALSGGTLPSPPWHWEQHGQSWRLENRRTGESLIGYFHE